MLFVSAPKSSLFKMFLSYEWVEQVCLRFHLLQLERRFCPVQGKNPKMLCHYTHRYLVVHCWIRSRIFKNPCFRRKFGIVWRNICLWNGCSLSSSMSSISTHLTLSSCIIACRWIHWNSITEGQTNIIYFALFEFILLKKMLAGPQHFDILGASWGCVGVCRWKHWNVTTEGNTNIICFVLYSFFSQNGTKTTQNRWRLCVPPHTWASHLHVPAHPSGGSTFRIQGMHLDQGTSLWKDFKPAGPTACPEVWQLEKASRRSWKPRHQQHPRPENQDSQRKLVKSRGLSSMQVGHNQQVEGRFWEVNC